MIEIKKLYSDENTDLLKVLEFIKDSHKIGIGAFKEVVKWVMAALRDI